VNAKFLHNGLPGGSSWAGLQLFSSNFMAGNSNSLPQGGAAAAVRQGNAPAVLSSGTATSTGNGCATLNAGFTFGFIENLFISQLHNPTTPGFVSKMAEGRFNDSTAERCNGNLPHKNAMTAVNVCSTINWSMNRPLFWILAVLLALVLSAGASDAPLLPRQWFNK
jgi:hypothetical protein